MPLAVKRCPWCGGDHSAPTVLCEDCEADAKRYKRQNGIPIQIVSERPDD